MKRTGFARRLSPDALDGSGTRNSRATMRTGVNEPPHRRQIMQTVFVGLALFLPFVQPAYSGGSDETVAIESFETTNATDYVLVVSPLPHAAWQPPDPYMGACQHFTVHGTYRRLRGVWFRNPADLTREAHLAAVAFLKDAFEHHVHVKLGWIGTGFVPLNANDSCLVSSRALRLYDDERGTAVVSFHDNF
jgi:hypothetical protein